VRRPRVSSLLFWANTLRNYHYRLRQDDLPLGARRRVSLLRHGFAGDAHVLYGDGSLSEYLPDFHRLVTARINGPYSFILDNKIVFEQMYRDVIPVPANLGMISGGRVVPLADRGIRSVAALIDYVHESGISLIKPVRGGGGRNTHVVRRTDEGLELNDRPVSGDELAQLVAALGESIICEFARQAPYAAQLFPSSTNSIRILTMTDPDTLEPFAAIAVQRIGTSRTAPVDNFRQGGLSSEIDLATGELGSAVGYPHRLALEWHEVHPETGAQISGVRIPGWRRLLDRILVAAGHYPFIRYAGWDAVATQDGVTLLEGNHYPNVGLLQVHRPLLADERVRRFYEHHRIVKPKPAATRSTAQAGAQAGKRDAEPEI
jgi:hypothetical protein